MADIASQKVLSIGILRPRNKEQNYTLIAAKLTVGYKYYMTEAAYSKLKADKLIGPLLVDMTLKPVTTSVGHALAYLQDKRS